MSRHASEVSSSTLQSIMPSVNASRRVRKVPFEEAGISQHSLSVSEDERITPDPWRFPVLGWAS